MGLIKKLKEKAQTIKSDVGFEELRNKVSQVQQIFQDDNVNPIAKLKFAGKFVKDFGRKSEEERLSIPDDMLEEMRKTGRVSSPIGIDFDEDTETEEDEGGKDSGLLDDEYDEDSTDEAFERYKKWFEKEYGISHEEHMANMLGNVDQYFDKEP